MHELYVERGLTIRELGAAFGVSDEYVRKRLRQCQLAKRPGTFVPKLGRDRAEVSADVAELYEAGHGMREVGEALGISSSEVRELLQIVFAGPLPLSRPRFERVARLRSPTGLAEPMAISPISVERSAGRHEPLPGLSPALTCAPAYQRRPVPLSVQGCTLRTSVR